MYHFLRQCNNLNGHSMSLGLLCKSSSCSHARFSVFQPAITGRMASSGMLRHMALVRTDISEELSASIIRVTRIAELGTVAVTACVGC
jgi:hypothetical protein